MIFLLNKNINLLPDGVIAARNRRKGINLLILIIILIFVIMFSLVITFYNKIYQKEENKNLLKTKNLKLSEKIHDFEEELKEIQDGVKNRQEILDIITADEVDFLKILEEIEIRIPKDVVLWSVDFNDNKIAIRATAANQAVIADFIYNMNHSDVFEQVFVSNISNQPCDNGSGILGAKSFEMNCVLKSREENKNEADRKG